MGDPPFRQAGKLASPTLLALACKGAALPSAPPDPPSPTPRDAARLLPAVRTELLELILAPSPRRNSRTAKALVVGGGGSGLLAINFARHLPPVVTGILVLAAVGGLMV